MIKSHSKKKEPLNSSSPAYPVRTILLDQPTISATKSSNITRAWSQVSLRWGSLQDQYAVGIKRNFQSRLNYHDNKGLYATQPQSGLSHTRGLCFGIAHRMLQTPFAMPAAPDDDDDDDED